MPRSSSFFQMFLSYLDPPSSMVLSSYSSSFRSPRNIKLEVRTPKMQVINVGFLRSLLDPESLLCVVSLPGEIEFEVDGQLRELREDSAVGGKNLGVYGRPRRKGVTAMVELLGLKDFELVFGRCGVEI